MQQGKGFQANTAAVSLSAVISCFLMTPYLRKSQLIAELIHTKRGVCVHTFVLILLFSFTISLLHTVLHTPCSYHAVQVHYMLFLSASFSLLIT